MKDKRSQEGGGSSRRSFLKKVSTVAGAIAVPYFVPASALGRGGAIAPSERILLGGIGIGERGTQVLNAMLGLPDVQFLAVCDVRKCRREAVAKMARDKYGTSDCAQYSDLRQFLAERRDLDALLIATGNRWHAAASVLAMRAGFDVYCEKPGCMTMAEGRLVVETARQYGRVYTTGAQRLSDPLHIFGNQMARNGRLGQIHTVYADARARGGARFDQLPAEPEPPKEELDWDAWLGPVPWRPYNSAYFHHYRADGWGSFYDLCHDVAEWGSHTITQALAGLEVSAISPVTITYAPKNKDMTLRLANGVRIVICREDPFNAATCRYWKGACGYRFVGSEGWISAGDGESRPDVSSPSLLSDYRKVLGEYSARTGRKLHHGMDFFECVRTRREPVANAQVMYNSMLLNIAADICGLLKRDLVLDLDKAEFVADDEANRYRSRAMREPWCV